jgi:hypothetical protein
MQSLGELLQGRCLYDMDRTQNSSRFVTHWSKLRTHFGGGFIEAWLVLLVRTADTLNTIIQSVRFSGFPHPLGIHWISVTTYVAALSMSSVLICTYLLKPMRVKAIALRGTVYQGQFLTAGALGHSPDCR